MVHPSATLTAVDAAVGAAEAVRRGMYERDELRILCECVERVRDLGAPTCVEIGSYAGRSTVAIAFMLRYRAPNGRVVAIDPHNGRLTSHRLGISRHRPRRTRTKFTRNIGAAGVAPWVEMVVARSEDVVWNRRPPISLLHVDGNHMRGHPTADFRRFAPHMLPGAIVVFHDYGSRSYPWITAEVDALEESGAFDRIGVAGQCYAARIPHSERASP